MVVSIPECEVVFSWATTTGVEHLSCEGGCRRRAINLWVTVLELPDQRFLSRIQPIGVQKVHDEVQCVAVPRRGVHG